MKSLKLQFESLLDDDDIFLDPKNDKKVVEEWIRNNYDITGKLTISDDFVVDCDKYVYVENKNITSLTNGMFKWGKVGGHFYCNNCTELKSLEGAPKEVGGNFHCGSCNKLTTLEGAPKEVNGSFDCSRCINLTSLEGAPEKINEGFSCRRCNKLTTLKGAPKKIKGGFSCSNCENLTSLEGAPEKVGGNFYCSGCNNLKITDSDRKKYKIMD